MKAKGSMLGLVLALMLIGSVAVVGATQPAALNCLGLPVTIVGTAGNDVLSGTAGVDVMHGLAGDDFLYGLDSNDVLCGGSGNDYLDGGNQNDKLHGGPGDDALNGAAGTSDWAIYRDSPAGVSVHLMGGLSPDGFGTNDTLDNVENLEGSGYNDLLEGNDVPNRIIGRAGDDMIWGLNGNDNLDGSAGFDSINGGAGGADACSGEALVNCP